MSLGEINLSYVLQVINGPRTHLPGGRTCRDNPTTVGRTRSSSAAAEAVPRGRGRAAPRGRARRGRGGRGARGSPSPPPRSTTHSGFPSFEFIIDLDCRLRGRLRLPDSFAVAVVSDDDRPTGFWLQVDGCPNGPSWADAEYTVDDSMLLGRGWKSFSRFCRLTRGQYLAFEYDGDMTLSMKIYRADGGCVECCVESDSSSCSRSFDEDEEDSPSVKAEESSSS